MKEVFVSLSLGDIACLESGSGPSAVFLHGAIATPRAYAPMLTRLSENLSVTSPTHPGHGSSFPITDDWTLEAYLDTYREFFRTQRLKPAVLIGHSFGAMLALLLAPEFPEAAVIAMNPCGLPLTLTVKEYLSFMTQEATDLILSRPDLARLRETAPVVGTMVTTVVRHPEDLGWFSTRVMDFDVSKTLRRLRNHTHLLWGEHDHIVPVNIGRQMQNLIPHSGLTVLPRAGHGYPITEPDRTYRIILEILRNWKFSLNAV